MENKIKPPVDMFFDNVAVILEPVFKAAENFCVFLNPATKQQTTVQPVRPTVL